MKNPIKIFAGFVCIVLLSGCSVYQHVRLASNITQNDHSEFLIENDSLSIIYSFYGQNGPIHIELLNKLDKPLFVDWGKSALITNGQSVSLWRDEARIKASATEYNITPENVPVSSISNIEGTIVRKDKISFIPPRSRISYNSYVLQTKFFDTTNQAFERTKLNTIDGQISAKKFSFSKEDSPLNFRIFLSISDNESFKNPIQFDNTFWASDYFATSVSPKSLGIIPGNQFYIRKTTGFSRTMGVVSLVGIITLGAALQGDTPVN